MSKQDPTKASDPGNATTQASPASPQPQPLGADAELQQLRDQLAKAKDVASRAQAELANVKIRAEKDALELRKFASESVMLRLLPSVDNLHRALKHLPKDLESSEWVKGIITLEQEFLRQLSEMGLKRFDSLHQPLDPSRHEVLMQGVGEVGTVIEVLEDGYELHGKVIRPAKVKTGGGS